MDEMKCGGPTGEQGGIDAPVQCGQAPSTFDSEREQVNVGERLRRREGRKKLGVGNRKVIWPELMTGCSAHRIQKSSRLGCGTWSTGVTGRTKNPSKAIFSQRTGSPAIGRGAGFKKSKRRYPMRMIGVPERNEHIDIEKLDHAFPVAIAMTRASSSSY